MKKSTWFLILLLFAVSCLDEPECYLLNNNYIGIAFRVMGSGNLDSTRLSQVLINGNILVFDKPYDSALTNLQLPLNYFENFTTLTLNSTQADNSLTAGYQRQVQFVSEECGPRYILSDLSVNETTFDSIRIVSNTPSRSAGSRHIEIFRCPITDTLRLTFNQLYLPASSATSTSAIAGRAAGADLASIVVNDSETMYTGSRRTTVDLPVDLNSLTTLYTFNFSGDFGYNQPERTIQVKYQTEKVTRYRGCGEQTFVTGLDIESANMDSVSVVVDANGNFRNTLTDPFITNINVYRCPPTNVLQAVFVAPGTTSSKAMQIVSIQADYTEEIFYPEVRTSTVRLPLNENNTTTTFTFNFEGGASQSVVLSYAFGSMGALFKKTCAGRQRIRDVSSITQGVTVVNNEILFPAVTNINIAVP